MENQMPYPGFTQNFDGKDGGNGDDIWKWLLLSGGLGGYGGYGGGFGGRGGYGAGGGGFGGIANALSPVNQNVEALRATVQQNTTTEQFNNLTQQLGSFKDAFCAGNAATNANLSNGFKDLCMQISDCCCKNQVATERTNTNIALASRDIISSQKDCCCETQKGVANLATTIALCARDTDKAICDQTAVLTQQSTANTQAILNNLTNSTVANLQAELAQAKNETCVNSGNAGINLTLQAIAASIAGIANNNGHH